MGVRVRLLTLTDFLPLFRSLLIEQHVGIPSGSSSAIAGSRSTVICSNLYRDL
jgi:hypothetical protein